jgi:hypothetical protein
VGDVFRFSDEDVFWDDDVPVYTTRDNVPELEPEDDRFPFTRRLFHRCFSEQGWSSDGMSLTEIEQACSDFADGARRASGVDDIYEVYENFRDFVHLDELSSCLNRLEWVDPLECP